VSKVLQETVPAVRSLGAIPKKVLSYPKEHERKTPKSESEKCKACSRCKSDLERNNSAKENKITQTGQIRDSPESSLEDLDAAAKSKENTAHTAIRGQLNEPQTFSKY